MSAPAPPPSGAEEEGGQAINFKLLVTVVLCALFVFAAYTLYAGATGPATFRKICEKGKGRDADNVLAELAAIAGEVGPPSENGTVIVQHSDGPRCVVRVTDDKVFSAIYEE